MDVRGLLNKLGLAACLVAGLVSILATNGGGEFAPPPPADASLGGLWSGIANGVDIVAFSTDAGQIRWMGTNSGEHGFGVASVDVDVVTLTYTQVPSFNSTLPDGSTAAICTGTGLIDERSTVSATLACSTSLGLDFTTTISLAYNPYYERVSSLAIIAGNYDDGGLVLTIGSDGTIFEQDPFTGCVINGQVSVLNPQFNIYDISMTYSSCLGAEAVLNGVTFIGLATLDDTGFLPQVLVGVTGDVQGDTFGKSLSLLRL